MSYSILHSLITAGHDKEAEDVARTLNPIGDVDKLGLSEVEDLSDRRGRGNQPRGQGKQCKSRVLV